MPFFTERLPSRELFRIALEYPERTLFLDIESTGLSHVYDRLTMVGWRYQGAFGAVVGGELSPELRDALDDALVLVTFNGILFDVPFLAYKFDGLVFPPCHVDLRFLVRRAGYSGGQKKVEEEMGFERGESLAGTRGGDAPLLWYDFLDGDMGALRHLVEYNHADVEGLASIFDRVAGEIVSGWGHELSRELPEFSSVPALLTFGGEDGVRLPKAPPPRDAGFRYADLGLAGHQRYVGIDLTGSETRPTGWALLDGTRAETRRLKTDDEIVEATVQAKPAVVSIDSPLSLPRGRTRVTDDDPMRKEAGIMREAERELKRRGVNVYPALIPSMQRLTERGIRLARRFRELGLPVIESYPGAAQDIMGIPRKQKGLDVLAQGLARFGISGAFLEEPVSHDELDAITSAVVAAFFVSGHYEGLGGPEENDLIIPDLAPPKTEDAVFVIGISGAICTGKTTAARMLEEEGFAYARFSQVVKAEVIKRGLQDTRENLQEIGAELHKDPGQRWLAEQVANRLAGASYAVIDGLRHPQDHAYLVERFDGRFVHIHLISSLEARRDRWVHEGGTPESFDEAASHPVEQNVPLLDSLAHTVVTNDGDLSHFSAAVLNTIPAAVRAVHP